MNEVGMRVSLAVPRSMWPNDTTPPAADELFHGAADSRDCFRNLQKTSVILNRPRDVRPMYKKVPCEGSPASLEDDIFLEKNKKNCCMRVDARSHQQSAQNPHSPKPTPTTTPPQDPSHRCHLSYFDRKTSPLVRPSAPSPQSKIKVHAFPFKPPLYRLALHLRLRASSNVHG